MEKEPNYYGIITAVVRYDDTLPAMAKLLFSEISALSNAQGYCYASNTYFANLYKMNPRSISRLISQLEKANHIRIELEHNESGSFRKIYTIDKNVNGVRQNCEEGTTKMTMGYDKNDVHNNKDNNKDSNVDICALQKQVTELNKTIEDLKKEKVKEPTSRFTPPTLQEVEQYFEDNGLKSEAINFYNFYESNGWKVGKNKMKVWRCSASLWINKNKESIYASKSYKKATQSYEDYCKMYCPQVFKLKTFEGYFKKFQDKQTWEDIKHFYNVKPVPKNDNLDKNFYFDICFGSLSGVPPLLGKTPQRRYEFFASWISKQTDYAQKKAELRDIRERFKNYLNEY